MSKQVLSHIQSSHQIQVSDGNNCSVSNVVSERVVREDLFTSLHIEEHSVSVRETKRGAEELTADIPNISEIATKDLDENGMIRVGTKVKTGDILIGKLIHVRQIL